MKKKIKSFSTQKPRSTSALSSQTDDGADFDADANVFKGPVTLIA